MSMSLAVRPKDFNPFCQLVAVQAVISLQLHHSFAAGTGVDQNIEAWCPDEYCVQTQANPVPAVRLNELFPLGAGELPENYSTVDHKCAIFNQVD